MRWDYGEDQDDGYGEEFARYFDVYMFTDEVVIKYFTHNGGYPSSVHRVARRNLTEYLNSTIYEKFIVPYGFNADYVRDAILEAM